MTLSCRHEYPYDTQHGMVINRGKFDACAYSSFRGVKTDRQTGRQKHEQNRALHSAFIKSLLSTLFEIFEIVLVMNNVYL